MVKLFDIIFMFIPNRMRFEGLYGENSTIIRFAVAPRNFSFVSKCGSEKNQRNSTFRTVYSVRLQETAGFQLGVGLM